MPAGGTTLFEPGMTFVLHCIHCLDLSFPYKTACKKGFDLLQYLYCTGQSRRLTKDGGDCVIHIQIIALYDAAVRLLRRLRFSVDVFYSKSSIKRLCGWTSSLVQTYRHLIGPPCMRQKATRSKASGAIVEYMVAIAKAWPRHAEQLTFTLLVVAVTLP